MKRPSAFHTGPFRWSISYDARRWARACVDGGTVDAYGFTDRARQRIHINPDQSDAATRSTLLHEALHAVCFRANWSALHVDGVRDPEEQAVSALEPHLFDALADERNTRFWAYLEGRDDL